MASGFIILKDGRSLAPRWTLYDCIIELVIDELSNSKDKEGEEFKTWLQTLVPIDGDVYNGFGGFIRQLDGENVRRWLDLRELTAENQELFWHSLQKALTKIITTDRLKQGNEGLIHILKRFLKMKRLVDIGDNPDNLSDWKQGYTQPPTGKHIGPGW